jgi:hypothetical protein
MWPEAVGIIPPARPGPREGAKLMAMDEPNGDNGSNAVAIVLIVVALLVLVLIVLWMSGAFATPPEPAT